MVWGFLSYRFCLSPKNPPAAHAGHTTPGAASGDIDSVDTYSERASARPGTSSAPTGTVTLVPSKSSPMGSYRPPRCPGEKRFGYGVERQSILRSVKAVSSVRVQQICHRDVCILHRMDRSGCTLPVLMKSCPAPGRSKRSMMQGFLLHKHISATPGVPGCCKLARMRGEIAARVKP